MCEILKATALQQANSFFFKKFLSITIELWYNFDYLQLKGLFLCYGFEIFNQAN